jgi:hypothetical protein
METYEKNVNCSPWYPLVKWHRLKRVCLIVKQFSLEYKWNFLSLSNAIERNGSKRPKFRAYYSPSYRLSKDLHNLKLILDSALVFEWLWNLNLTFLRTQNIGSLFCLACQEWNGKIYHYMCTRYSLFFLQVSLAFDIKDVRIIGFVY